MKISKSNIENIISSVLSEKVGGYNDSITRGAVEHQIKDAILNFRGSDEGDCKLRSFEVKCDKENNPPELIDKDELAVEVNVLCKGRKEMNIRKKVVPSLNLFDFKIVDF